MKRSIKSLVAKTGYSPSGALEGGFGSIRGGTGADGFQTNNPPSCKTNSSLCDDTTNQVTACTNSVSCAGSINHNCTNSGNCGADGSGVPVTNTGVCTNVSKCKNSWNQNTCFNNYSGCPTM